jgi:hypothetical protein
LQPDFVSKILLRLNLVGNELPKSKEAAIWKHIGDIDFRKYVDFKKLDPNVNKML